MEARRFGVQFSLKESWKESKVLFTFSLPSLLSSIMVGPVNWICAALLVNQPYGYKEMGIFNAANQWFIFLLFFPNILGQIVLPILSEQMNNRDKISSKKFLFNSIKLNFLTTILISIALCIFSRDIMSLYGENFSSGWLTLIFVMITGILVSIQIPVGQFFAASGLMWTSFLMNLGWAFIFIIITIFIVDKGSLGLSIARGSAYMVHTIWFFIFLKIAVKN